MSEKTGEDHDLCFANCTKEFDFCNEGIRQRARDVCAIDYANNDQYLGECLVFAEIYHSFVSSALGTFVYNSSQKESCNCCTP